MPAACSASVARAHLRPTARRQARIGRAQDHGIVAPGVGEPERRQVTLVDEGVGRHDFDRGDAERRQMRDDRGLREAGEAAARRSGISRRMRVKPRTLTS